MATKRMRITRITISLVLTLALVIGMVPVMGDAIPGSAGNSTKAAAKNLSLYEKKTSIGLYQKENVKQQIKKYKKKAKYTYKSNKKKVVSVSKKGIATAKKLGTAKITITEKYKGKTKKATFKITVRRAIIRKDIKRFNFSHSACADWKKYSFNTVVDYVQYEAGTFHAVIYKNKKAKYEYYSSNKNILDVSKNGKIKSSSQAGTVNIKVKEVYKKKKRLVGSYKFKVYSPRLDNNGGTIIAKYYGDYDEDLYEPEEYDEDYISPGMDTIFSYYNWVFVCQNMSEVNALKENVSKVINDYKIVKNDRDGGDDGYSTVAAKEEKVLKFVSERNALITTGIGERYIVVFDGTIKKPAKYLGYNIIKVVKGKLVKL